MKTTAITSLFFAGLLGVQPALADEREFLSSLKGTWAGKGTVITRIGTPPINVNCTLNSKTGTSSLNMSGTCRGFWWSGAQLRPTCRRKVDVTAALTPDPPADRLPFPVRGREMQSI